MYITLHKNKIFRKNVTYIFVQMYKMKTTFSSITIRAVPIPQRDTSFDTYNEYLKNECC